MTKLTFHVAAISLLLGASCNPVPRGCLAIGSDIEATEHPYPLQYKEGASGPIVFVLEQGTCVDVMDIEYGKDFAVYEVRRADGKTGYVAHSSRAEYSKGTCPDSCGFSPSR